METADAVVIGAGANGTSTAFHLARAGVKRVVVVERRGAMWEVEVPESVAAGDKRQRSERALEDREGHREFTSCF